MKLNITVCLDDLEIGDYYEDGSVTLSEIIQKEIIREVVCRIKQSILDKYYKEIQKTTEKKISELTEKILKDFKNSDETFTYTPQYQCNPVKTTFKEFVANRFTKEVESSCIPARIERVVEELVKEIKNRYDLAFASLIVKNMKEQKLLADDKLAELIK